MIDRAQKRSSNPLGATNPLDGSQEYRVGGVGGLGGWMGRVLFGWGEGAAFTFNT